jgi:uncharacterized protein (TIGR03083 family)
MSDTTTMPDLTRTHREGFISTLEGLTDSQWLAPSSCARWRVIDVAAHLAWAPVMGVGAGAVAMARHGFSMNRMIAGCAIAWADRGRDAILDQLRSNARTGARPVGMPPVAALADAVVHGLDVRRPLGLPGQVPAPVLGPLADFALATPWPMNVVVGGSARRRGTPRRHRHGLVPRLRPRGPRVRRGPPPRPLRPHAPPRRPRRRRGPVPRSPPRRLASPLPLVQFPRSAGDSQTCRGLYDPRSWRPAREVTRRRAGGGSPTPCGCAGR